MSFSSVTTREVAARFHRTQPPTFLQDGGPTEAKTDRPSESNSTRTGSRAGAECDGSPWTRPAHHRARKCARLRSNLCGEVFIAETPAGVGTEKYDETAASMIGLLKYGAGLPFNRIEKLEQGQGIPLPAATQWEVVERAAGLLAPAHEELIQEAAQGEVLYNDDTTAKVLELGAESQPEPAASDAEPDERTGVFTSGIVSTRDGHRIALFFTGRQHAGENLADVLARRAAELQAPIQCGLRRRRPDRRRQASSSPRHRRPIASGAQPGRPGLRFAPAGRCRADRRPRYAPLPEGHG